MRVRILDFLHIVDENNQSITIILFIQNAGVSVYFRLKLERTIAVHSRVFEYLKFNMGFHSKTSDIEYLTSKERKYTILHMYNSILYIT